MAAKWLSRLFCAASRISCRISCRRWEPAISWTRARYGALVLCLIPVLGGMTGCGYSHTAMYPDNIGSVGVPIFDNRTPYRGVEFDLTEALIKEIELRTPYKVVHPSKANTVLRGVITNINQRVLSQRKVGGLPDENEVTMLVNFDWKNQQTGEKLRDRRGLPAAARYAPARGLNEPFEIAQHSLAQVMAARIVDAMRKGW